MAKKIVASICLGLSSLIVFQPLFAKGQFYAFSDIGSSANTDYSFTEAQSPLIKNDINYTSYRLGGGYSFDLTEHFSIGTEAAYNFYGKEDYYFLNLDQASLQFSANDILFVTAYHFTSGWEAHIKTGVAYEQVTVNENYLGGNLTEKEWVPEAAAGIAYHFTEHWSAHADFAYLMGWESGLTNMPDITVGWLGISYGF